MKVLYKIALMLTAVLLVCSCAPKESRIESDTKKVVEEISNVMLQENWTNIECTEGLPLREWCNEEFSKELQNGTEGKDVYTVCGSICVEYENSKYEFKYPAVTAVARIAFDEHNPDGERLRVWYICDNGKYVSSDNLGVEGVNLYNEPESKIVDAYHVGLWVHMFSVHTENELLLNQLLQSAEITERDN